MAERITVAEAVGRTLAQLGIGHAFGVVGSGNFHATNAMLDAGVPYTATRHEMGAVVMADAYSRIRGEVAVASLHQGCGLTNGLTGISEAAKAHSSVLVVAADTPTHLTTSNFWVDQDAAVVAVGARAERVHSVATVVDDVWRAYVACAVDRATAVLSVPVDLQEELIDWAPDLIPPVPQKLPSTAGPEAVAAIVDALDGAQRPILVGGRGARHAGEEIRRLGEVSDALIGTSAGARGLFEDDPWSIGVLGGFATDPVAELVASADLIVVFGAALNRWTTRSGRLVGNARVLQVDDRREAIGWHRRVDLGVVGDSAATARAVRAEWESRSTPHRSRLRTPEVAELLTTGRAWRDQPFEDRGDATTIDPRGLTIRLDALLPRDRTVAVDGGNFCGYPGAFLRVPDAAGYVLPLAFQSIGLALAAGIGSAIARPDRLAVVGVGDGGFLMSHVELETAVRAGLRMLVIVYDDHAYGAEVQLFGPQGGDRMDTVEFPDTDLAAIARGYGCDAVTVRSDADLDQLADWLSGDRQLPMVIDAKIAAFPSWMLDHGE